MRSNCLAFALAMYWRRARKGERGYLVIRQSKYGYFPHFLYLTRNRRHLVSFCPVNPKKKILPPPVFRGRLTWGDN